MPRLFATKKVFWFSKMVSRLSLHLEAWSFALNRSRFSVIVLIAGFVLLMSDQGQDLLIALSEDEKTLLVSMMATFWALSVWFWSRVLLDINFKKRPGDYDDYYYYIARMWLPRFLGVMAFVAVLWSAYQADQIARFGWMWIGLSVFVIFVVKRRDWLRKLAAIAIKNGWKKTANQLKVEKIRKGGSRPPPPCEHLWESLSFGSRDMAGKWQWFSGMGIMPAVIFLLLIIVWVGLFLWATWWPISLGTLFGAMVLFFLWGASFLPLGSVLSYWADKKRIPLLTFALLFAIGASWTNDNHKIRSFTESNPTEEVKLIANRKTVSDGIDTWRQSNTPNDKAVPFVIVATAGGGIRAAYWTGTVLGKVHDNSPIFARRLFAISGVSGGSVGATVYRAFLELGQLHPKQFQCIDDKQDGHGDKQTQKWMKDCIQNVLGKDLLGPVAARLLFPDLLQRFWPWPWFPDRGTALELGLENSFQEVVVDHEMAVRPDWNLLREQGIARLQEESHNHKPALFLNSTWSDNGRRIVASNLRFATAKARTESDDEEVIAFTRLNDQLAILNRDLRLSTAAHNSARFPGVSPPGMWKEKDKDGEEIDRIEGRLQDGGLFENYGAETALEILELACKKFNWANCDPEQGQAKGQLSTDNHQSVFPVVILISSDPSLWNTDSDAKDNNDDTCGSENLAQSERREPIGFAYELRSTFRTYERVRGGRGKEAADRLCRSTMAHNGKFFHFRMCEPGATGSPPLGWALSEKAKARIESYLIWSNDPILSKKSRPCFQRNHDNLVKLNEYLNQF